MSKTTDIRLQEVNCNFEAVPFRAPLKFGGRVVDGAFLINVDVVVETRNGRQTDGMGSMPLGNVWAWPTGSLEPEQTEAAMKKFAEEICVVAGSYTEFGHPLDIMYNISGEYHHLGKALSQRLGLDEAIPELAQLVSASPLDAAVHDAYGRAHNLNSYNTLSKEFVSHDLSEYLDEQFAGEYLDQYTLRQPKERLPLYHLVGALDPLTDADIGTRINDGLPETLGEWITADGLTHLKIKLSGDQIDWDVDRVFAIDRVASETQSARGVDKWFYSCDFNEKCENVAYVLEFLERIRKENPAAYDRIQYIEQPTSRDLEANPDNKMHEAAKLKPVVIDESLVDYDSLLLSRELGYSGVALKACKGQTESLLLAAAAQKFDMFLCVQDLTCPGYSFLHSASLAANIPTVTAIEGNGRQYCPGPNKKWASRFPSMFNITDGTVGTGALKGVGLGF
ncbi:MAG: mandelate racemase/muconate lactonizing enzyme family protein [Planctomycetaceae bacterium]|jgi:L-alanine-DL-glutamate epimerase-like enolase superfamily enzyme|nr:mandelate racemase/muconate lactonizing enzyme family protein [Planctomycetaceae bacterium]MBT6157458.1 mandelate racemase/muconate lactonizing enzyme family protein [Planctomycetaceae bacterium]MBT6488105.1 mandelate racemase/muconate lactonizing enzyme family protein [Planctomycetaceae bacterium]MBT6494098.1 mandelate racemase/muconate lactonizing enzyme family protein [Planctomycetaceae bacterium]